jgi:hypothetical protein
VHVLQQSKDRVPSPTRNLVDYAVVEVPATHARRAAPQRIDALGDVGHALRESVGVLVPTWWEAPGEMYTATATAATAGTDIFPTAAASKIAATQDALEQHAEQSTVSHVRVQRKERRRRGQPAPQGEQHLGGRQPLEQRRV